MGDEINNIFSQKALEQIPTFIKGIEDSVKAVNNLNTTLDNFNKTNDTSAEKTKKLNDVQQQSKNIQTKTAKEKAKLITLNTEEAQTLANLTNENLEQSKALRENAKQQDLVNKRTKEGIKDAKQITGAYKKESATLNELRNRAKDVGIAFGTSSKRFKTAARDANQLDARLKKLDKTLGQNQRNVGNYAGSFNKLGAALGITVGAAGIFQVLKNSLNIIKEFDAEIAKVQAITGATADEFDRLEKSALQLGASTLFTSTQVAQLQLEYAKLGFSTKEILNATEATLQLSTATGEDLGRAAEIAGSTLRSFGIDASETQRVVDVLAKGFTTSALNLENFAESIKLVAPLAAAANIPIEVTTNLLGKLADAGLKGSIGGTGLKNVFLELTNSSSKLSKFLGFTVTDSESLQRALTELSGAGLDLATAQNLIDKRGQAALLTLAGNVDIANVLKESYEGVDGAARAMAEVNEKTLAASFTKLSSAWSGLILSFKESTGFIKEIVDDVSLLLNLASGSVNRFGIAVEQELLESVKRTKEIIEADISNTEKFIKTSEEQIIKSKEEGRRKDALLIKRDQNIEKSNLIKFKKELAELNAEGQKEINEALTEQQQEADKLLDAQNKLRKEKLDEELELRDRLNKDITDLQKEANKEILTDLKELNDDSFDELSESIEATEKQIDASLSRIKNTFESSLEETLTSIDQVTSRQITQTIRLLEQGEIGIEDFNSRMIELNDNRESQSLQATINSLTKQTEFLEENSEERLLIDAELNQAQLDLDTITTDKKIENAVRLAEAKEDLEARLWDLSKQTASAVFEFGKSIRDKEIQSIQSKLDQGLISETAAAKKIAALKRKQAIADKAAALFQIAINTAQAVAKVQAQTGTLSPFVIPIIIASAAIQAALVAASPIPQFFKGTDSTPTGKFSGGEKGRELMMSPSGGLSMVNEPTVFDNMPNYKIWNNAETEQIMKSNNLPKSDGNMVASALSRVESAIINKKETYFNFTNNSITDRENGYSKTYLNKKIKGIRN